MKSLKAIGLVLAVASVAFAGCLRDPQGNGPGGPAPGPVCSGGITPEAEIIDLDVALADNGTSSQILTIVDLSTGRARPLTTATAGVPSFAGPDLVLHQLWNDSRPDGLAATHVDEPENTTRFGGAADGANAVWPLALDGSMYFTLDRAGHAQLYRMRLAPEETESLVMNLSRSDQPDDPVVISSDGTLIATAGVQGAPAGDGGGPQSTIMIRSVPDGAQPSAAYAGPGEDPRFVDPSTIVFEQDGDLKLHNISSGAVETGLEGGTQSLSYPTVGSDGSVWFRAEGGSEASSPAWICQIAPDSGEVTAVLEAEEWRIGRFDVDPQADRLVVETTHR